MNKSKLIFFIDALMFLVMTALAGLGLVIKYVLIPGREAWAKWGRQMEITWLGLDRHAWVGVLPYLVFLLLSLFILHVILDGRMMRARLTRLISQPVFRLGVAFVFLVVAMTLLALPLLVTPEVDEVGLRGDLGLETPSSGVEGFRLGPANSEIQKSEPAKDPAGEAVAEVEWAKEESPVKAAPKKSHFAHWPKSPKYQTIYSSNLNGDKSNARSRKPKSTLQARCQLSGRRSFNKDIGG
jgi:hypothetical protein